MPKVTLAQVSAMPAIRTSCSSGGRMAEEELMADKFLVIWKLELGRANPGVVRAVLRQQDHRAGRDARTHPDQRSEARIAGRGLRPASTL